tara:strand:- start:7375 stop:7506 length:132 start_codon:yes stop_codon:yes gene_type:complete
MAVGQMREKMTKSSHEKAFLIDPHLPNSIFSRQREKQRKNEND